MKKALFILPLVLGISAPLGASNPLAIRVSPAVAFAPANLVVRATVEARANNRRIEVVAESDAFYRSSEMQLDGDRAPRTAMFEFRSVPVGAYQVHVQLLGSNGEELAFANSQVNIVPGASGF